MVDLGRSAGGQQLIGVLVGQFLQGHTHTSPEKAEGVDPPDALELLVGSSSRLGRDHVHPGDHVRLVQLLRGPELIPVGRDAARRSAGVKCEART